VKTAEMSVLTRVGLRQTTELGGEMTGHQFYAKEGVKRYFTMIESGKILSSQILGKGRGAIEGDISIWRGEK